jgi:hypothetical protein
LKSIRYLLFLVVLDTISFYALGQDTVSSGSETPNKYAVTLSYFGEMITRPGAIIGLEWYLLKGGGHSLSLELDAGTRIYPRNNNAFFVLPELSYRFTFSPGFFLSAAIGAGCMLSYLAGDVYEYQDGQAVLIANKSSLYFMPDLNLGIGWDFSRNNLAPITFALKFHAFGEYPYNTFILPCLALQAEVTYGFDF